MEVYATLNSGTKGFFRAAVRSYMYGSRWKYGQEINYKKIAAEVENNLTTLGQQWFLEQEEFKEGIER
jgi:hypothetical protein